MRNFSIVSILLALAAGAILWQKLLVNTVPDRLPDTGDYSSMQNDQIQDDSLTEECNEEDQESSECEPELDTAEQGEMEQQRGQAHDVMMKSFDEKLDKYKGQINVQQ